MKLSQIRKDLPEDMRILIMLIARMRERQQSFFRFKEASVLEECKRLEQEVDKHIKLMKEPEHPIKQYQFRAFYTYITVNQVANKTVEGTGKSSFIDFNYPINEPNWYTAFKLILETLQKTNATDGIISITINNIQEVKNESY